MKRAWPKRLWMYCCFALATTLAGSSSYAQTIHLKTTRGYGDIQSCRNFSVVNFVAEGDYSALLLSEFSTEMNGYGSILRLSRFGVCHAFLSVLIPQGYTLTSHSVFLTGGVTKDLKTHGYIDLLVMLTRQAADPRKPYASLVPYNAHLHRFESFGPRSNQQEALLNLADEKDISRFDQQDICKRTRTGPTELGLYVALTMFGARQNQGQTMLLAVDSVDQGVTLKPTLTRCPSH